MVQGCGNLKNKGQALVEFVVILPIFLMILMCIIDFSNIIYKKYNLESHLDNIVRLYNNNQIEEIDYYVSKNNFVINYTTNEDITTITIKEYVKVNTPVLSNVLNSPYLISISREIYAKE